MQINAEKRIIGRPFQKGHPGGPGRPKETEEDKIIKRAVKEWVKDHEEALAEALPEIRFALIKQAKKGDIRAIHEIHKVIGAHKIKNTQTQTAEVQVNWSEIIAKDREKYS